MPQSRLHKFPPSPPLSHYGFFFPAYIHYYSSQSINQSFNRSIVHFISFHSPILSYPILSHPILSYPILSYPTLCLPYPPPPPPLPLHSSTQHNTDQNNRINAVLPLSFPFFSFRASERTPMMYITPFHSIPFHFRTYQMNTRKIVNLFHSRYWDAMQCCTI